METVGPEAAIIRSLADRLRAAHLGGPMLLLPNAWDAESARTMVEAGAEMLATSSGGVARSLGMPDGERLSADEMFAAVNRMVAAAEGATGAPIPVTADIERGYGLAAAEVVRRTATAGACGFNIEDSDPHSGAMIDQEVQARFIRELRGESDALGLGLVINARIDMFVRQVGPEGDRVERAAARAKAYFEAGADCVFPIMLKDAGEIRRFVGTAGGPVNIMYLRGTPTLSELAGMGVRRVTFGSGFQRHALRAAQEAVRKLRSGTEPWTV